MGEEKITRCSYCNQELAYDQDGVLVFRSGGPLFSGEFAFCNVRHLVLRLTALEEKRVEESADVAERKVHLIAKVLASYYRGKSDWEPTGYCA